MRLAAGQLGGEVLKAHTISGIRLAETICHPNHQSPKHSHELFQFCLIREGGFTESYGRKVRDCAPLSLISHPSDEAHANRYHDKGARCFVIEIEDQWVKRALEHSDALEMAVHFKWGLPVWLAARLYREFQCLDAVSTLIIEGLTLELLALCSRQSVKYAERQPPHWIEQVIELLKAHFSDALTLDWIAQRVGVHAVHLARVFRQHQGCTIGEFLRTLQIEYACRELSLTDAPLSQIALSAGFYDQSHFSRVFKRAMNITPTQYRKVFRSR